MRTTEKRLAAELAAHYGRVAAGAPGSGRVFSLARVVDAMSNPTVASGRAGYFASGNHLDGFEREVLEEVARIGGRPFDPARVTVPWTYFAGERTVEGLTRDLVAGTGSAGGYLVSPAVTLAVQDALRPWSVTARAGCTIEAGLTGTTVIPTTVGTSTGYWLATEATAVTESGPTLGAASFTPKNGGAYLEFSRQLLLQGNADRYVERELMRSVGGLLDAAAISGTGTEQPLGVLNTSGIGTQSGTSLNIAGIAALKGDVASANAADDTISFVAHPDVRELLEKRVATGSGEFLWKDDRVGSRTGYVTTLIGTNLMVCGSWPELVVGLWGPGLEFMVNPYGATQWKTGKIEARVLVAADVAVRYPAAFSVATSIT